MDTFLVYVRRSYKEANAADVSDAAQEAAARAVLPAGAVVEVIADSGGHNSGYTDDRAGYQRLIERVRSGEISGIAVYDLSRLARNTALMLTLRDELERRKVGLFIATMPGVGFDGAAGRFMFTTLCAAAQLQRDMDSERAKRLTRTKHEQGGHNGLDPFGYRTARDEAGRLVRPHRLEVVEAEAEIVRDIFDRYAQGAMSQGDVAAVLNSEGIQRRGRRWVEKSVADILRRRDFYLGHSVYHRGASVRPGTHEPVISPEQAHLAERAAHRRYRPGRYGLTGRVYPLARVAFCSCGLRLRAETRVSRGRGWSYYVCPGRRDGRCQQPAARAETADAVVLTHLAAHAAPDELVGLMRAELARLRHLPGEAQSGQRARIELAMKRLGDRYVWGELDEADYRAQRRILEGQLAELPAPADSNVIAFDRAAATLLPMARIIQETTPENQRAIIRHVVEAVEIRDGEVVGIAVRAEARPFFRSYGTAVVIAPPDGSEALTTALVAYA